MTRLSKKEAEVAALSEQVTSKELEYRIVAVNKAGDGEPSNTVMVVLEDLIPRVQRSYISAPLVFFTGRYLFNVAQVSS